MKTDDQTAATLFTSSWASEWGEDDDYTDITPITKQTR